MLNTSAKKKEMYLSECEEEALAAAICEKKNKERTAVWTQRDGAGCLGRGRRGGLVRGGSMQHRDAADTG